MRVGNYKLASLFELAIVLVVIGTIQDLKKEIGGGLELLTSDHVSHL